MKHAYLFLLLFSIQLKAQQTFVSLEQFSQFALQQNLQLQQADLSTKIERQNVNAAISPLLPNINVSATLNDNLILNTSLIPAEIFGGKAGTFKEIKFGTKYNFNPNGTFSLNLINAANYQNLLVAKKNAALAGANSNVVRDQLKTQIAQAYYSYLLYKKNAEFSSRNLKNADSLLQIVTVRFNNQFVDELDLNRSRAAQILASNQFRQATLLVEKSLNTLKLLAAIPVSQPLEIRDEIAYSSNAPAFGNIQNRPSFIKAQLQNEVSELAVTREKLRF
ncbi:MAG: TolC family protein, partial [Chitinophagales bacterium]